MRAAFCASTAGAAVAIALSMAITTARQDDVLADRFVEQLVCLRAARN
jgi:hypothetical protein